MIEPFELGVAVRASADPDAESGRLAAPGEPITAGSVEALTEDDYYGLASRSRLGAGLANITSHLMARLATGGEQIPSREGADTRPAQGSAGGNPVRGDPSPLVAWKRVVAMSSDGDMLALVSRPDQSDLP